MNEQLQQVLQNEETVLFIGSGVSAWSGLPSWGALLEKLADHLDGLGVSTASMRQSIATEPIRAASYAFGDGKLFPSFIGPFLRDTCGFAQAVPHEIHQRLASFGAKCFITTNYDTLLEQALATAQPGRYQQVVKNNQPIETHEITSARARRFVFKLHGDMADSASIILTEEQYIDLQHGGERKHALKALETLLLTRPVVYVGFGLRDLDFRLVQGQLASTWKHVDRQHYALLPDPTEEDQQVWHRTYGIRVVGYPTVVRADNTRDHQGLLTLLEQLRQPPALPTPTAPAAAFQSAEARFPLLRYAAGVMQQGPAIQPEIPLRVKADRSTRWQAADWRFEDADLTQFLAAGPPQRVLIGLPGAGKSYALRRAAARAAEALQQACLTEVFDAATTVVPVVADMKLYAGDLRALLEQALPEQLSFEALTRTCRVHVLLDSFNEMPREQWEQDTYEADLAGFVRAYPHLLLTISSRTTEGLAKLQLPTYDIAAIDDAFLRQELQRLEISVAGAFGDELLALLSKPFFYQLVARRTVQLPAAPRPRDVYASFFERLTARFATRFGCSLDLTKALCGAAYEAINTGQEAMPRALPLQALRRALGLVVSPQKPTPEDVLNWLVSEDVLLPYAGQRLAFFHQSVTEYLAATELARRYTASPAILAEKLTYTRWDQALFLTLSLLPPQPGEAFLNQVLEADLHLAARAAKYLEEGSEAVVSKILDRAIEQEDTDGWLALPVTTAHDNQLRRLTELNDDCHDVYQLLARLHGPAIKEELISRLIAADDADLSVESYSIGSGLQLLLTEVDIPSLLTRLEQAQAVYIAANQPEDAYDLEKKMGAALGIDVFPIKLIREWLLDPARPATTLSTRTKVLVEAIDAHEQLAYPNADYQYTLQVLAELLLLREESTATEICRRHHTDELLTTGWECFTAAHVAALFDTADQSPSGSSLLALGLLAEVRPDLRLVAEALASTCTGLKQYCLRLALGQDHSTPLLGVLQQAVAEATTDWQNKEWEWLQSVPLDMRSQPDLVSDMIRLRNPHVIAMLANCHYRWIGLGAHQLPLDWSLEWFRELQDSNKATTEHLLAVLTHGTDQETLLEWLTEFNLPETPYRNEISRLLARMRLHSADLTTEDLSDSAIAYLLNKLQYEENTYYAVNILGELASETFVREYLLPLRPADPIGIRNLRKVLDEAGRRHQRRYLV